MCLSKKVVGLFLITFLCGGWVPVRVFSQEPDPGISNAPPQVELKRWVEKEAYRVDEVIPFRLLIRWKENMGEVKYRPPLLPLENLTLIETAQTVETRIESQNQIHEKTLLYRFKPLKPGRASIGRFVFEYTIPDSARPEQIEVSSSVFDIKPLPNLFGVHYSFPIVLGATSSLFFFGALFLVLKLRSKRQIMRMELRDTVSLEEGHLSELETLEILLKNGHRREYVLGLSDLMRKYLKYKFQLNSANLGGLEIYEWIERRRDISHEEKNKIRFILERLSESQFAGAEPNIDEVCDIKQKIKAFIHEKKLVSPPPAL